LSAEQRADRLGATLLLFGLVRESRTDALAAVEDLPMLSAAEWEAWRAGDDEDVALALACINAEFELREAEWRCLEFLLYVQTSPAATSAARPGEPAGGAGTVGEGAGVEMVLIPRAQGIAVAIQALSWHLPPPQDDV